MSIQSDFAAYTNAKGFLSNKSGSSGNDILYSCEAAIVRKKLGAWSDADDVALKAAIASNATVKPGLYARPDGYSQDEEARDDYTGLAAYSPVYALAIQSYGKKHWWYFKTAPCKWYLPMFWLDLAFVAHVKWCTVVETPNLLFRLIWCLSVAFSGTDQDSLILNWLLTGVAGSKGWVERLATKRFQKKLAAAGGIKAVFAAYFNDPNHPLAKYAE